MEYKVISINFDNSMQSRSDLSELEKLLNNGYKVTRCDTIHVATGSDFNRKGDLVYILQKTI